MSSEDDDRKVFLVQAAELTQHITNIVGTDPQVLAVELDMQALAFIAAAAQHAGKVTGALYVRDTGKMPSEQAAHGSALAVSHIFMQNFSKGLSDAMRMTITGEGTPVEPPAKKSILN